MRKADNYFAVVPEWVLFNPNLSDQAVRLYGVLRRYADQDDSKAWPSVPTLAKRMHRSDRSVQRAMHELLDNNAITLVRTPDATRSTNTYVVRTHPPPVAVAGVTNLPPQGDGSGKGGGDISATQTIANRNRASTSVQTERAAMFEAMVEAWHGRPYEVMASKLTKSHRGQVNRAIKELLEIGAQPSEITEVARRYRQKWPEMQVTPNSLVKHWHTFTAEAAQQSCAHEWELTGDDDAGTYAYACKKCPEQTTVRA